MVGRFTILTILLLSLVSASCGRIKVAAAPGGRMHITCAKGMKDCVTRASKVCGDEGYRILAGESRVRLLGGSSSAYRRPSETAELEVECGVTEEPEQPDIVFKLPRRKDAPLPEGAAPATEQPPGKLCVPGATQHCIGPGACEGGQVCLQDGSGFGGCDCGNSKEKAGDDAKPSSGGPQAPAAPAPQPAPKDEPAIPGAMPAPEPLSE